jgi:class 3 adenylate cyclase/tetratricopeptide (TPR) repeat protein
MATCAVCGYEAAEAFKFCPECGATLGADGREQRKVVSVLFCDVVGSTALGEAVDPELTRLLLARYFEGMKGIVERHGGTVEKFIGDAVMAVFGIPQAHEDDALRACRAALEMQQTLPELELQGRIGITTGEVVTGTEERLATGDAVNIAARLEQAAEPGEVLVGETTLALVREAVETKPLEPLLLKGKAEPVEAFRLLSVHEVEPRQGPRFVGREREPALIHEAWERALSGERCELLTIAGEAGVGKSRLVAEALASVDARVVQGRCLSYGQGITYWPVVETLKQLDALPSDPVAATAIRSLLGESETATSAEEIAWAFRKLLEEQAPLIAVFDDIQWAEETFLDLIEYVALLSSGASILLLCLARPDLTERRPTWPVTIRLEPLGEAEIEELLPAAMTSERREQIRHASGGNPLFVTEIVAMTDAGGEVAVPPTLQALLSARLDQLERGERSVLERGAVEGEIFHRGAVQALAPEEQLVTPRLASLVRKELIRPDKSRFPTDDAFRFRHVLIRDAAYESLSKLTRARMHEQFAEWLEDQGELVELDEIAGYHLEQAARYQDELGEPDPALAERAGERLALAGRRAVSRGDDRAAASLLGRALDLTRPTGLDVHLEMDLADALSRSETREAIAIADAAADRARAAGNETAEALARVVGANVRVQSDPGASLDELERLAHAAIPLLERAEDHAGLAYVWYALGVSVANFRLRFAEHAYASEQALHHARLAGQPRNDLFHLDGALAFGPVPADEAIRALDVALGDARHPHPLLARAYLLALLGRFDEAWEIAREQTERLRELRGTGHEAWAGWIAQLEGDEESAAHYFRVFCDSLEEQGQTATLSGFLGELGRSLCVLGRHDEAEPLAQRARDLTNEEDVWSQVGWRELLALVLASRGEHAEAVRLAREAVAIMEPTDALCGAGQVLGDLAEVLIAAGRVDEARTALEQALDRYERKKNLVMAQRVRARLADLRRSETAAERP